jgi:hypothetical protein
MDWSTPTELARSIVTGVPSGNLFHAVSSGPAVALVLNQISLTETKVCEYCAGTLPVADTLVLDEQATRPPVAISRQPIHGFQRFLFSMGSCPSLLPAVIPGFRAQPLS